MIKTVFECANKKGTIDKQHSAFNILNYVFSESKLYKGYLKYKALYVSPKCSREDMGHNLLNFLYTVGMAHGASALATADYKICLLKEDQFHGMATETDNPYNTLTIIRNEKHGPFACTKPR